MTEEGHKKGVLSLQPPSKTVPLMRYDFHLKALGGGAVPVDCLDRREFS